MILTQKERKGKWTNYKHLWPVSEIPTNYAAFSPVPGKSGLIYNSHFIESLHDLPGDRDNQQEILENTISNGNPYPAESDNRYRILWNNPHDEELYSLIVELRREAFLDKDEKHYLITIYQVE